jgi:deoxyribodipyrimidine photo-lyase
MSNPALVWFARDLRLRDHPALTAALEGGGPAIPVFCFDDRLLEGRHRSGPRTQFLIECLADLDRRLRDRGSGLVVRRGHPERELARLAREVRASALHFSDDVGPFARRRAERVRQAMAALGVEATAHPGTNVIDVGEIATRQGRPYTVFSPFHRTWLEHGRRPVVRAHRATDRFLAGPVDNYARDSDALGVEGTSRLSPYLHFGCVSPRQLEERLGRGAGPEAFRRQLCWRDFHHHVLLHFPQNARSEFQDRYRGRIKWSYARRRFAAWCDGQTGFPLVDAGMRQLLREGWMHNRARLVVGSFLTKDLGIDWRWGERWFMRMLIDGDEANNNGNWQWIASVGTDPQPAFRRIYNPARQQQRHDPEGRYVRRYVPELERVPDEFLGEPATMPENLQREIGCVIGVDYPAPMVDHARAREDALERYRLA